MTSTDATPKCRWCGVAHPTRCPQVKSIEYAEDGVTVRKVEFLTPADYVAQPRPMQLSDPNLIVTPLWPSNSPTT